VDAVIKPDSVDALAGSGDVGADSRYIAGYALVVAIALAVGTWIAQSAQTDPSMVAAGAFFVIGFDLKKTFVGGIARLIGIFVGIVLATLLLSQVAPGPLFEIIMIVTAFLVFALAPVHPSFLMLFLTIFLASGWRGMEADVFELTIYEKVVGETIGVAIAMIALILLQAFGKQNQIIGTQDSE